jgi:hypothetical protein
MLLGAPSAAAEPNPISVAATIDGHDVAGTTASRPLRLHPDQSADVAITITNNGDRPVEIRQVELAGRVLGLTFFSYITAVDANAAPGSTNTLHYRLDLARLSGQVTGLIGGELTLQDGTGAAVATIPIVSDVRGSLVSVYGLFGIALVALTMLALLDAAIALARHRLSTNRWHRGLRLLTPGIGIGLVLAFSTSVARLWVPDTATWLLAAAASAAAFFAIGYFSPTPAHDDYVDEDEVSDDEMLVDANPIVEDANSRSGYDDTERVPALAD